jgi:hypothetical protein
MYTSASQIRLSAIKPKLRMAITFHNGTDYFRRDLRHDGVAVAAQSSHSGG